MPNLKDSEYKIFKRTRDLSPEEKKLHGWLNNYYARSVFVNKNRGEETSLIFTQQLFKQLNKISPHPNKPPV
jgi:hypothetical protein